MRYAVMVPSYEGTQLTSGTQGTYWESRVYWATWDVVDSHTEALGVAARWGSTVRGCYAVAKPYDNRRWDGLPATTTVRYW